MTLNGIQVTGDGNKLIASSESKNPVNFLYAVCGFLAVEFSTGYFVVSFPITRRARRRTLELIFIPSCSQNF
jgi:hypothetical protein